MKCFFCCIRFYKVFILTVCVFAVFTIYGCGGGGGGGGIGGGIQSTFVSEGSDLRTISGKVVASATICSPSVLSSTEDALTPVVGAEVWLEEFPEVSHVFSNAQGEFIFENVKPGNVHVVAQLKSNGTVAAKNRTRELSDNDGAEHTNTGLLTLFPALNHASGILRDGSGNVLPYTPLSLWGETFSTDKDGKFEVPPLPENIIEVEIKPVSNWGTEKQTYWIPLTNSFFPPFVEIESGSSNNLSPSGILSAMLDGNSVRTCSPNSLLQMDLRVHDDKPLYKLKYQWYSSKGKLTESLVDPLKAAWQAPEYNGIATVSAKVTDSEGSECLINIHLLIGITDPAAVDIQEPHVTKLFPASNSENIATSTAISVFFNEAVQSENLQTVVKVEYSENVLNGKVTLEDKGREIVWTGEKPLLQGKTYYVSLNSLLTDSFGNKVKPIGTWSFKTVTPEIIIVIAALSNLPEVKTTLTSASITVGGAGITKYSYCLDGGDWSSEFSASTSLNLSSLLPGQHTLKVIGIDSNGNLQSKEAATTFNWTIDELIVEPPVVPPVEPTVEPALITGFVFELTENADLVSNVSCTIDGTNISATLPFGIARTSLKPTITHTGISVKPVSGEAADFTNPVVYTVTSKDNSSTVYTVTVVNGIPLNANIVGENKFSWSENCGWINFNPNNGGVSVHLGKNGHLRGFAWSENIGWVKFAASSAVAPFENTTQTNWGVNLSTDGKLTGFAWSENAGWINFGATDGNAALNESTGFMTGFVWSENLGWIKLSGTLHALQFSL
ncbi:MAG: Ig-like domain-containing protein [Candidatus Riflebacteria bacterium]|nr:Ig-like domain-containing protein [Candidatus Riflebacteria bacterium]